MQQGVRFARGIRKVSAKVGAACTQLAGNIETVYAEIDVDTKGTIGNIRTFLPKGSRESLRTCVENELKRASLPPYWSTVKQILTIPLRTAP